MGVLDGIDWASLGASAIYWMGYGLVIVFMIVAIFVGMFYVSFPYKMTFWPVVGTGQDSVGVDRPKTNRIRWNKHRTAWQTLYPLMNKKEIEPFDPKYIYPGRNLFAFKIGENYIPARIRIDSGAAEITPIPYHIRQWQMMELKQNEAEFTKNSWWDDNKQFMMVILTTAICMAVVAVTVYYTYKFAAGGVQEISQVTNALKSFSQATPK